MPPERGAAGGLPIEPGVLLGPIPRERQAKVDAAREAWIRKLVDLSRRNNLLYFRDLKVGTLDLTDAPGDVLLALLQSGRGADDGVLLDDLCRRPSGAPPVDRDRAARSLKEIAGRALGNFEEKGLQTLFLAVGMAEWTAGDGGRNTAAPVLLVPLEAVVRGGRAGRWWLRRSGDVQVNHVLTHGLEVEHRVSLSPDELVALVQGDDAGETLDLEPVFDAVRRAASAVPGFRIERRWVIGNFAFQKLAIVKDLRELSEPLARHNLVAGVAGDLTARTQAQGARTNPDPREFDRQSPDHEFLVLDADSTQHQAIAAALQSQNGVVSGPPGTGKSQTIANLIAEFVSRGKTVLFVAEKRAALDVVKERLAHLSLDQLCLDCHGAETSRRLVAQQLQQSLDSIRQATPPDTTQPHARFVERREQLNQHVAAMHAPRFATGLSLYRMYGLLLGLNSEAATAVRFGKDAVAGMSAATIEAGCELLNEGASHAGLVTCESGSPWTGARLLAPADARTGVERVARLAGGRWAACEQALSAVISEIRPVQPGTVGSFRRLVEYLNRLEAFQAECSLEIFGADPDGLAVDLAPAAHPIRRLWANLFDARFRTAVRRVRGAGGRVSASKALTLVQTAQDLASGWAAVGTPGTTPAWSPSCHQLTSSWTKATDDLQGLQRAFPARDPDREPLDGFGGWLKGLAADLSTPMTIVRLGEIERKLVGLGVGAVWGDLRSGRVPPELWPDVLRHAWLSSAIDEVYLSDSRAAAFSGRRHDEIAAEFRKLDRERLRLAVQRVRRAHAVVAVEARNRFPAEDALVTREAQKRSRHLPLRRLFSEAPHVLLGLRPCWMASPLSVSQLIPGDRPYFDVVIFDEASQVLPEDAVTSVLRGRQAVVAGDKRQLPPTTFFAAADGDDRDEDGATAGFESILDVMSSFLDPPWSLDWHYRSRDEALIAYSNHKIYDGRLVTFPGAGGAGAMRHELVPHDPSAAGQEQSAAREVRRVVELILRQARERPDESLGVITMGIAHANRIQMELDRERQALPELDQFFGTERHERFFIKNLERVQGDERDAIILSIGYSKNEAGKLVYRFGPLLQEGGERRLNVAITRARRRMTVVSSFSHADMDPEYPRAGVRHLRAYLEYAANEGKFFGPTVTDVPLNEFEQSVKDALKARGLSLVGQVGSSRYRIDLAAMHPSKPGRFVLAIECDGASYHSAPSARDRDRLRQQQLEALNWRFCRIWSTDWFLRREDEIARVMKAFDAAVAAADAADEGRSDNGPAPDEPFEAVVPPMPSDPSRSPRPHVASGLSIDQYSHAELRSMVRWVKSDGRPRIDEEILAEVAAALGFQRKRHRIVGAIKAAIDAERGTTR